MLLLIALMAALAWGQPALAQTGNRMVDLQSHYQTDLRALALGNAWGPVARGEGALLHNPAGLAQFKFDMKVEGSAAAEGEVHDEYDFFGDTYELLNNSAITSTDVYTYLDNYPGTTQNYRTNRNLNAVFNLGLIGIGFGAAKINQKRYSFEFQDSDLDGVVDGTDQFIQGRRSLDMVVGGFAFTMLDGQMLIGIGAKTFTYKEEVGSASYQSLLDNSSIEFNVTGPSYKGTGFDLGFIWRMETLAWLRGQYSLTAYNIGGITLEPDQIGAETLEVPATYNVGVSFQPSLPLVHILFALELEDVTDAYKVRDGVNDYGRTLKQRGHVGLEVGLFETSTGNNVLNMRVGSHRGFTSYGYELNLFSVMRLIYTKYRDNYGHVNAQDLHDFEAYQLSLGLAW